ncbi:hypothetical protein Dform_00252 [Dehalogenimonas formicexedens]|uniref:DUF4386 domain-containing protein n=1 Tax=Dehalogenimonas formicexedens TaxID=1839801 RepID=A0A1P8F594_9CHLR|nr:DUF4386 domain-containing protein [Dehalogenimonas formicexedens]APV43615.1 hypothetical protein Dform_00252 [Dehalogenimonas formicexedens]
MNTYRKTAITAGILFILCTATSIIGPSLVNSVLSAPDYLNQLAGIPGQTTAAAIIEFLWAATGAGIAIVLYPLLKRYNRASAISAVVFRVIEGVFVLVGTFGLLSLFNLSHEFVSTNAASASSYQASGSALLDLREWAHGSFVLISFSLGSMFYSTVLYRSRLIPRWLSGWGIVGAVLCLGATLYSTFNSDFGFSAVNTAFNAPIGLQEMVLAVWLMVKGFNQSAIGSESIKTKLDEKALAYSK